MKIPEDFIPFVTDTTHEAAYLMALGAKTPILDRSNPKRINYIFELTEVQNDAMPHFRDGTGDIKAQAYSQAIKSLMSKIHKGENEG